MKWSFFVHEWSFEAFFVHENAYNSMKWHGSPGFNVLNFMHKKKASLGLFSAKKNYNVFFEAWFIEMKQASFLEMKPFFFFEAVQNRAFDEVSKWSRRVINYVHEMMWNDVKCCPGGRPELSMLFIGLNLVLNIKIWIWHDETCAWKGVG